MDIHSDPSALETHTSLDRQAIRTRALRAAAGLALRSGRSGRAPGLSHTLSWTACVCVCVSAALAGCSSFPDDGRESVAMGTSESGEFTGDTHGDTSATSEMGGELGDLPIEESGSEESGSEESGSEGQELDDCLMSDGSIDWDCCEAQDWQPVGQCTPWGPPAPPRARTLSARARVALGGGVAEELWV